MRRLFTVACVVSALLWILWLLILVVHCAEYPLELDRGVAQGLAGLAVLGIIPALWAHKRDLERIRAKQRGLCRRCGYNLMGNVSGTCPECGTPVGETDGDATARGNRGPSVMQSGPPRGPS